MKRKTIGAWLVVVMLITQFANGFGFMTKVKADGTEITDPLITSVTMSVYDNGVPVTDVVYKQGAEVKLTYNWELPDNHNYKGEILTPLICLINLYSLQILKM